VSKKIAFLFLIVISAFAAVAEPLVTETENYKIIAVSPLESWSGDKASITNSVDACRNKEAAIGIYKEAFKPYASSHPYYQQSVAAITKIGFSYSVNSDNRVLVFQPIEIQLDQFESFITTQNAIYKQSVIAQGNPRELESKTSSNKILGSIVSLATTAVLGSKFGNLNGAQMSLNSGMNGDVYQLVARYKDAMAPVDIASFTTDFKPDANGQSKFTKIEARLVHSKMHDRAGQVIIGYKTEKTPELEAAALETAIIHLVGADTSVESLAAARQQDYARRLAIWDAYVAQSTKESANDLDPKAQSNGRDRE
jgi:hypothetical protein